MKKTYRLKMPKGVELQDANLTADDEYINIKCSFNDKFKPKKGDFIVSDRLGIIAIYNYTDESGAACIFAAHYLGGRKTFGETAGGLIRVTDFNRLATTEEVDSLLKKIYDKENMRWNPEKFEFEDIRWRADMGGKYYRIWLTPEADVSEDYDLENPMDYKCYESGNYFQTKEEAQAVADKINELFEENKHNKL